MPTLDEIFQTGEPVSKTDVKTLWPSPSGETGVLNSGYEIGDVRRYGVFPDGVTDWETDHFDRMTAIYANSILPEITIYWPAGEYATSMNVDDTYSGSKMYFDKAVFYGILHLVSGVSDVSWLGDVSTYDRFGITTGGATNIELGIVRCLADGAKNIASPGVAGRGVHIVNATNLTFELFDIEDCDACDATSQNLAAVAIESEGLSGLKGAIWVRQSQTNGVVINTLDIDVDIRVDGYGAQAIDAGVQSISGLSTAQVELGSGVILQRCTGRADVKIDQSNASPAADTYTMVIPETGISTVSATRHKALEISSLYATVGDGNRGVCIGSAEEQKIVASVNMPGSNHIRRRGTDSLDTGYAGLNVLAPLNTNDFYRRLVAGSISFSNFAAVQEFAAAHVASPGLNNYTEVVIGEFWTDGTNGGCISLVSNGGILKGSIGYVHVNYTGGSSTTPGIVMNGCTNFNILGGGMRCAGVVDSVALQMTNCLNCVVSINGIHNYGRTGVGAIAIDADNSRCTLGPTTLTRDSIGTSTGIRFSGTQTDCIYQGLRLIGSFATGFDNGASMAFTRPTAIACVATGNTDDTDLTTSDIAAANQLGCTNFAV